MLVKTTTILIFFWLLGSALWSQQITSQVHGKQFDLPCSLCHTTDNWQVDQAKITFDHATTGYLLVGAHRSVTCRACHTSLIFSNVGNACIDCHTDIHHGEFNERCERCHTPQNWENRYKMFRLHNQTRFPLLGVHAIVDCQSCHTSKSDNDYKTKDIACKSCHLENYLQTLNPAHQKAGFNLNCQECHLVDAVNWRQTIYEHSTRFPLTFGHAGLACADCHSEQFKGTSIECFACHQEDYNRTAQPNHRIFGFPTVCAECHSTRGWERSQFDHLKASGFALNGAHANASVVQCIDCHVNNQLTGLPRDCYGCHQKDYQAVSDPNHLQGNFPHDCLVCHNEQAWSPANFDHASTNFPLTGAHATVSCSSCHQNGYAQTPTECIACHQNDYDRTDNPNHRAAGFPTLCQNCHSTTGWTPANWDHDTQYFPIYSGKHRGEWNTCADCHVNENDYTQFECINCHEHNRAKTDDKHKEVTNYVYESNACYNCHPTGNGEGGDDD